MRTFTRAIAGIAFGIAVLLGIFSVAWTLALNGTPLEDAIGTGIANAALDASGVKGSIDEALRSNVGSIAAATGLSNEQVETAIDELAIESWSATTLPEDASVSGTFSTSYRGASATVTTYADPSYITVEAYGQDLTLAVPESAQQYLSLLAYL
ncbi:hypothetical protein [uncultured Enorma sp.]|jgi:hypothetical protein|uniref:hypothetical protein n=1 Tax=uncultured Enorma sp. TaxID=1714346 RepID=UPI0026014219|nr:hypothetical protein [uncultured Enorma sp.]